MVKVKNKRRLKRAFTYYEKGVVTQKHISKKLGITPRRFRQMHAYYRKNKTLPIKQRKLGRPRKERDPSLVQIILEEYAYAKNALYLERTIFSKYGIRIPHNWIHEVLLMKGLSGKEPNKSRRRKPWIRYEREHSLSAGHIDWHRKTDLDKHFCAIIDDASRNILACGEFDNATAENSIKLVGQVVDEYGYIKIIEQIISDHGTQFCPSNGDKNSEHAFSNFLESHGIKHILCRVKHPQSNGKIEKFFHLYDRFRFKFASLDEFIKWYNEERPHGSLNLRHAETPEMAFWRKIPIEYRYSIAIKFLGW